MINYLENHYFSSLTGLTIKQFDDIYQEIEEKYEKHELKVYFTKGNTKEKEALVLEDHSILT